MSTAARLKYIHAFGGTPSDGSGPSGLIKDAAGNLYGTTEAGGSFYPYGNGTVFAITPDGSETVLYSFTGGTDGDTPVAAPVIDASGNLYGTTYLGGNSGSGCNGACGVVFKLGPDGTETVLHAFTGGSDGANPSGALVMDKNGNLFGTTQYGGGSANCSDGCGTVFEITADGTEKVLHSFAGFPTDGELPNAGPILDRGDLYGTTVAGGNENLGSVYKVARDGTETVLYGFVGGSDGANPYAPLLTDKAGNLYSTTLIGGGGTCTQLGSGCGTVFKLATDGSEAVLHSFAGYPNDGAFPFGGLIADKEQNLYGTTNNGGAANCDERMGCGTIFKLDLITGGETVLRSLCAKRVCGAYPAAGLIRDGKGTLFGTTFEESISCTAGACGTVFRFEKK